MEPDSVWQRLFGMGCAILTAIPSGWERSLLIAALAVLPFLITYLTTLARAYWVVRFHSKGGVAPPTVPYMVPFLANTVGFATDTPRYLANALKLFGKDIPFRIKAGPEILYYFPHGKLAHGWLKNSRRQTLKGAALTGLAAFGLPSRDRDIFLRDDSGIGTKPAPGFEDMNPDERVFYITLRDVHALLAGQAARNAMGARFIATFTRRLQASTAIGNEEWTIIPDFYVWFRRHMFVSMIETICGPYLLSLNPDFYDEFWEYDRNLVTYMRRTPRWLAPKAYRARDKALSSIMKWRAHALEHFDYSDKTVAEADWDPYWGTKLMRARSVMLSRAGFSAEGAAAVELGMIWASHANIIPSSFWAFLGIQLSGPGLISRIRAETAPCFDPATGTLRHQTELFNKPLLGSCYMESLRLSGSASPLRAPEEAHSEVEGWKIPEKENVSFISIPWFGGLDSTFWNQGRRRREVLRSSSGRKAQTHYYEHPVESFWAERFLQYPNDPSSGPVAACAQTALGPDHPVPSPEKTAEDDARATLVTGEEIHGYWYPYGGGTRMCPGRFFAKQLLMSTVAIFMNECEFKFGPEAKHVKPDLNYLPMGNLPPDRSCAGRVRRRAKRD